LFSVRN